MNSRDFVENGMTLQEAVEVGAMLEEAGIDAIELSGGLLNNPDIMRDDIKTEEDEAYFQDEAKAFKEEIHVPLILVGGIRSYAVAGKLVEQGAADFISMSRPFICEPDLVRRWQSGDTAKAACISCNNCVEQGQKGLGISCIPRVSPKPETFFPQVTETVSASAPHPPSTNYKISIGLEQTAEGFSPVVKIELEHNGVVLEQAPYFPIGSDDFERVNATMAQMLVRQGQAS